jgi:NTP pyrophosphatase (non-canonical NTP hydrolase)
MSHDQAMARAVHLAQAEVVSSTAAKGPLTQDLVRASAILMEEVGEVAQGVLAYTRRGGLSDHNLRHIEDELAQVANVALQMLANVVQMRGDHGK